MSFEVVEKHFLVVGFGSIGKRHVRNLRELFPDSVIIVLRHNDGCKEQQLWREVGADHCVDSLEEALLLRPFAAIVANPASCHIETASILAHKGIHLLIEKPFSNSGNNLSGFLSLSREKKIGLMIGYNLRFSPSLQKFRTLIEEEYVGRTVSVKSEVGQYLPTWRPGQDYRQGVSAKEETGGGVLLELSHEIDYLLWLFGQVKTIRGVVTRQGDLEIDVDDIAHVIFTFDNEIHGGKAIIASLSMDFLRHDTTRCCIVIGTKGTLRWNGIAGSVECFKQGEKEWKTLFVEDCDGDFSYKQELLHFVQMIDMDKIPFPDSSLDEAKSVVAIVEAIQISSINDKVIQFDEGGII